MITSILVGNGLRDNNVSANSVSRIQPLEQSLWVFTCQSDIKSDVGVWLQDSELSGRWQSTTELTEIRQALLNHSDNNVLLDMRTSPHQMLTRIRYLKEHFVNCTLVALVDPQHVHWGEEALKNGVDAYVSKSAVTGSGLCMLLNSLQVKHNQQSLLVAATDPCTGLINGPLFFDRLNHALQVAVRHHCRTGILLVSLDDYGDLVENSGDELCNGILAQVAQRLNTTIRNSDSLARISEGLFAVLLEDLHDEVMVAHIAQNIQQQFEKALNVQSKTFSLSASIGGHLCEPGELNGGTLYHQTQKALERAIASGKQGLWFYIQDMNFKAMARLNMLQGLERALENDEFYLQYQPNHTGKGFIPSGVIPVMCWKHPTAGTVMPEIFMDLLIDSGLIIKAGIWMIEKTCEQLNEWRNQGNWNSRLQLFIPVSEKQLRNRSLIQTLIRQFSINQVESEQVILKLSEQTATKNIDVINDLAKRIPNIGIAIELQGSSSGYNSFSYLKEMSVDYLCLDDSFFQYMHVDHLETSIATVIVKVAHSLGIEVLACGADSQYKVDKMQALGCDALQGKYFSQPVYSEQWANYLMDH